MPTILSDVLPIPAQRHPVDHPAWCDPQRCTTHPDTADELLVTHRCVVLDEPDADSGRLAVSVVRGEVVCARGGELLARDAAAVRVAGVDALRELTPAQAGRLAAAVARAAGIAGGAR